MLRFYEQKPMESLQYTSLAIRKYLICTSSKQKEYNNGAISKTEHTYT